MQGLGQNVFQATLVEGECSDQYLNPAHVYLQANQLQSALTSATYGKVEIIFNRAF